MTTLGLCTVDGCTRDPHDPDAGPNLAAPGLLVCGHHADHTRHLLRELPELWEILGEPPGRGPRALPGGGDDDTDPRPSGRTAATETRTAVEGILLVWLTVLHASDRAHIPDPIDVARTTRHDVVRHQADADVATAAWRAGGPWDLRNQADAHRAAAARLRDHRATGRDLIEAHRELLDRNLAWLLGQKAYADQLVHDIAAAHWVATSTIPGRGTAVRVLCDCGTRVPIPTPTPALITCPGCGTHGTLTWWRTALTPGASAHVPLRDLPELLDNAHGIVITERTLREWRDQGHITSAATRRGGLGRPAQLFDVEAVAIVARARLLGQQARDQHLTPRPPRSRTPVR